MATGVRRPLRAKIFLSVAVMLLAGLPCRATPGYPDGFRPAPGAIIDTVALLRYRSLADDTAVADSVRMVAAGSVADAAFIGCDFRTATVYYTKAMRLEGEGGYFRFRAGCAALAAGDTAGAIAFLTAVANNGNDDLRNRARVRLGDIAVARGEYPLALKWFQETGAFSAKNGWSVGAFIGKLTCAKNLGLADSAAVFERLLSLYAKTMLEKERFEKARALPLGKKESGSHEEPVALLHDRNASPARVEKSDSVFTLQVGAFSSRERAMELRQKLMKNHRNVACVPALVSKQTFYRVWVGDFSSREEADRFGKDRFMRQGQSYRIVVRQ